MQVNDTIAAISSPPVPSPRIVVRLSGSSAAAIVSSFSPDPLPQRGAGSIRLCILGSTLRVLVYRFVAPATYTGQDVIEIHLPGNPLLARMLLQAFYARGARPAEAGEFTARAYFAGRIDLAEAEAIAAMIDAHGEAELAAARRLKAGALNRRLKPVTDRVVELLSLVEAGIDFSEEPVELISVDETQRQILEAERELERIERGSSRFDRLTHEPEVVLAGRPNAGKSTLLNTLAGRARAVVSPRAGTTRDPISIAVVLPRGTARITDVAGLSAGDAEDPHEADDTAAPVMVRQSMSRQAVRTIDLADVLVLVVDSTDRRQHIRFSRPPDLVIAAKADLAQDEASHIPADMRISAHTQSGIEELRAALDRLCFGRSGVEAALMLNSRHLHAIGEARDYLSRARDQADRGAELLAAELRLALDWLGQVTGQVTPDDVLGRVFASFCIGK